MSTETTPSNEDLIAIAYRAVYNAGRQAGRDEHIRGEARYRASRGLENARRALVLCELLAAEDHAEAWRALGLAIRVLATTPIVGGVEDALRAARAARVDGANEVDASKVEAANAVIAEALAKEGR